jgi:hypothetical protein
MLVACEAHMPRHVKQVSKSARDVKASKSFCVRACACVWGVGWGGCGRRVL